MLPSPAAGIVVKDRDEGHAERAFPHKTSDQIGNAKGHDKGIRIHTGTETPGDQHIPHIA